MVQERRKLALSALVLIVILLLIRGVAHGVLYRDGVGVLQIALLDAAALPLVPVAAVLARSLGTCFASLTVFALATIGPMAGFGWAFETFCSAHLSNLYLGVALASLGAGVGYSGPWRGLAGGALVAGGTHILHVHQGTAEGGADRRALRGALRHVLVARHPQEPRASSV